MAVVAVWLAAASLPSAAEPTLVDAAERGDRAAALRLLSKGANPNAPGADGSTAIMYAAANDDLELVRALIKAGANVKAKNQFGTTAMTEAAIIGSAPVVGALLKAGARSKHADSARRDAADGGGADAARWTRPDSCSRPAPTSMPRKPGAVSRR